MKKSTLRVFAFCLASLLLRPAGVRAAELLLNGTFATTVAIPAGNYSSDVGRTGAGGAYTLAGTTGATGWFTTAASARFEIWTAGFMGTPAGIGNALEFANGTVGDTIYQSVTSTVGGGTSGTISFGYAARDPGKDAFTVSVTDTTAGTTVFSQALNPTNALSSPITFTRALTLVPGDVYRLSFLDQSTNGNPVSAHIDSVSFAQVPEPSAMAAMLGACMGLLVFARRRAARPTR